MLKKICFATLLLMSKITSATQCDFINNLAPFQEEVAYQSYRTGQPYNLGLTAIAIAWEESKLGLYKVRFGKGLDVSFGVGHTLSYYRTKGMNTFQKSMWIQETIENNPKSIGYMIEDLLYWQDRTKGDWLRTVASYNGGNKPNYDYASRIVKTVKELKECEF